MNGCVFPKIIPPLYIDSSTLISLIPFALNIFKIEDLSEVFNGLPTVALRPLPLAKEKKSRPLPIRKFLDLHWPKIILKSLYLVFQNNKIASRPNFIFCSSLIQILMWRLFFKIISSNVNAGSSAKKTWN